MRPLVLLTFAVVALAAAPAASAQTPPPTIAPGVLIGHTSVGGMTGAEARAAVQAAFDVKVSFYFHDHAWAVKPSKFGAYPRLLKAVQAALAASMGEKVPLHVYYRSGSVRSYVGYLNHVFYRAPKNSKVFLSNLKPVITRAVWGRVVRQRVMRLRITSALVRTLRMPIRLEIKRTEPALTRLNFGPILIV